MILIRLIAFVMTPLLPAIFILKKRLAVSTIETMERQAFKLENIIVKNDKNIKITRDENKILRRKVKLPKNKTNENMKKLIEENETAILKLRKENKMLKTIVEQKLTEANKLREENNKVRELLVSCKLSENAGETIFQGAMQIGLLLLSITGKNLCFRHLAININKGIFL